VYFPSGTDQRLPQPQSPPLIRAMCEMHDMYAHAHYVLELLTLV